MSRIGDVAWLAKRKGREVITSGIVGSQGLGTKTRFAVNKAGFNAVTGAGMKYRAGKEAVASTGTKAGGAIRKFFKGKSGRKRVTGKRK